MTFDIKIRAKVEGLKKLLQQEYPELLNKEASIKNSSPESGFWYSGYYVALCDVLRLMDEEMGEGNILLNIQRLYEIEKRLSVIIDHTKQELDAIRLLIKAKELRNGEDMEDKDAGN